MSTGCTNSLFQSLTNCSRCNRLTCYVHQLHFATINYVWHNTRGVTYCTTMSTNYMHVNWLFLLRSCSKFLTIYKEIQSVIHIVNTNIIFYKRKNISKLSVTFRNRRFNKLNPHMTSVRGFNLSTPKLNMTTLNWMKKP